MKLDVQPQDARSNPASFASRIAARLCAVDLPTPPAISTYQQQSAGDLNHLHARFDAREVDLGAASTRNPVARRVREAAASVTYPLQEYLTSQQAASARLHDGHVAAITALQGRVQELEQSLKYAERTEPIRSPDLGGSFLLPAVSPKDAAACLEDTVGAISPPGPALDLRCGAGATLRALREHGITAVGVDHRWERVGDARDQGLAALTHDWQQFLPTVSEAGLGAITAIQILEWGARGDGVLLARESFRALRPGGQLIVETIDPVVVNAGRGLLLPDFTEVEPEAFTTLLRHLGFVIERHEAPASQSLEGLKLRDDVYVTGPVHRIVARRPTV